MALIATKVLKIGFVIAALPGNVVSPEAVEKHGWQDGVEDDGKGDGTKGRPGGSSANRPAES